MEELRKIYHKLDNIQSELYYTYKEMNQIHHKCEIIEDMILNLSYLAQNVADLLWKEC